jgi:GGDEF domain-containing protein
LRSSRAKARSSSEVRGDNLVARLGDDEFAIVLASDVSPNEASDFADRLIRVLSAPLRH